jgi:hypothetical protein
LKPPPIVVKIVDIPSVPCTKLNDAGFADTVKLGCEDVTVRVTMVVIRLAVIGAGVSADDAVTVSGYVPGAVLGPTAIVIVELPAPGAGIIMGLKLTVVPLGMPVADNITGLLNPPPIAVVIVDVACVPCTALREAGFAVTVKPDCDVVTVRVSVVVCVIPPPLPVTVIG